MRVTQIVNSAALIGLGRIGVGYDLVSYDYPRSHIGALTSVGFDVVAAIDPDKSARELTRRVFSNLDNCEYLESVEDLPEGVADIIVVASPSEFRLEHIKLLIELGPKVLFVEKPLALSVKDAEQIVSACLKANIELRVNFHRRFDPAHLHVRDRIATRPSKVIMTYGKGLFNYASHLVDFTIDLFGEVLTVQAIGSGDTQNLSFICTMADGLEVYIIGLDELEYDQFDIDVFLPNGKLNLHLGGCDMSWQRPHKDRFYKGYTHLGIPTLLKSPAPISGLVEFYANAIDHLKNGKELKGCSVKAAAHGVAVLEAVAASRMNDKAIPPAIKFDVSHGAISR